MSVGILTETFENGTYRVGRSAIPINPHRDNPFIPGPQFYLPAGDALERIAWAVSQNLPVLLIGETGVGKTLSVRHLAHVTNNGFRRVNLNGMTTVDEFVGKLMINEGGTYWVNGILIDAMEAGDWLLIDEINACLPEIAFCLHSLLDDDRMIVLSEYDGRIVRPNPNFRLFASMNPHEDRRYGGTKPLNEALLDRFPVTIRMEYLPIDVEIEVVMRQSGNEDRALVERMVRVAHDAREAMRNEKVFCTFSTRRLIDWARMAAHFDPMEAAASTVFSKVNPFDAKVLEDIVDNHF
ncbi:MAG: AAA family ATPase [Candidatus Tectomicrobia bacterium]|uniref:AAA family ATPase n=1 Tax=Tectimicrobiota bacterium TaxID=2528274 RepID=A0A932ZSZ7_UNCTE|nr:AAA family ATPase [Candidatus Tectomicrobia bacterium]MBI4250909.1 AAA family ATPase [Candidatus Tectomicrobia bacterium]